MRGEARVLRFEQGSASTAYVPGIDGLTESGTEIKIDALLARTEQTSGSSDLAGIVSQRMSELQRYVSEGIESCFKFKTFPSTPIAALTTRHERVTREELRLSFLQFENQIRVLLEDIPVEDGYVHPAEAVLEQVIHDAGDDAGDWLTDVLVHDRWNISDRAALLRLLSRQKPFTEAWRSDVIRSVLASPTIELRDAAVQAAESWEDSGIVPLLQAHHEPCPWLADYISRVIRDLLT